MTHECYILPSFVHNCLKEIEHILIYLTYPQNFIDFLSDINVKSEDFNEPKASPTKVMNIEQFKNQLDALLKSQIFYNLPPRAIYELMKNSEGIEYRSDVTRFMNLLDKDNSGCSELLVKCINESNFKLGEISSDNIQNYRFLTGLMLFTLINKDEPENEQAKKTLIESALLRYKDNSNEREDYLPITKIISEIIMLFNINVVFYLNILQFDINLMEIVNFDKEDMELELEDGLLIFLKTNLEKLKQIEVVNPVIADDPELLKEHIHTYITTYRGKYNSL